MLLVWDVIVGQKIFFLILGIALFFLGWVSNLGGHLPLTCMLGHGPLCLGIAHICALVWHHLASSSSSIDIQNDVRCHRYHHKSVISCHFKV